MECHNRERVFFKGYLRRECADEILSEPRTSREVTTKKMNAYTNHSRGCKVMDTSGINGALTSGGKDCGRSTLVLEDYCK